MERNERRRKRPRRVSSSPGGGKKERGSDTSCVHVCLSSKPTPTEQIVWRRSEVSLGLRPNHNQSADSNASSTDRRSWRRSRQGTHHMCFTLLLLLLSASAAPPGVIVRNDGGEIWRKQQDIDKQDAVSNEMDGYIRSGMDKSEQQLPKEDDLLRRSAAAREDTLILVGHDDKSAAAQQESDDMRDDIVSNAIDQAYEQRQKKKAQQQPTADTRQTSRKDTLEKSARQVAAASSMDSAVLQSTNRELSGSGKGRKKKDLFYGGGGYYYQQQPIVIVPAAGGKGGRYPRPNPPPPPPPPSPPAFDRYKYCSNLSRRLCGKCSKLYKKLVKRRRCRTNKKCKNKFRKCLFGKKKALARQFEKRCANRLTVRRPIKDIFGHTRNRKGRWRRKRFGKKKKFDYQRMRLKDWCQVPRARLRPEPEPEDPCGEFEDYFAEYEIEFDIYCPVNKRGLPEQDQDARTEMEKGFGQFLQKESACFNDDPCEQIIYDTVTIFDIIVGTDCDDEYRAAGIPLPPDDDVAARALETSYDGTYDSFNDIMHRSLKRKKKTRSKKRSSGRCRGKCNRKKKKRRLLKASFDNETGAMTLDDGMGKVRTYSLRSTGTKGALPDDGHDQDQAATTADIQSQRDLQVDGTIPTFNIGDLTDEECAELAIEKEIKKQNPEEFRDIDRSPAIEISFSENKTCDLGAQDCSSVEGGYVCCGVGGDIGPPNRDGCLCEIASETRCEAGTTFTDGSVEECYINANGVPGIISSSTDNLCCDLRIGPPIDYRYNCSASVCDPLPTAFCKDQAWITDVLQDGNYSTKGTLDIVDTCAAALSNGDNVKNIIRSTIQQYMLDLIRFSGCESDVTVSNVQIDLDTSRCPSVNRRLGSRRDLLDTGSSCRDPASGQQLSPVSANIIVEGDFKNGRRPNRLPVEEIIYENFNAPPNPAPSPGDTNTCSCEKLICERVREALKDTAGSNVKNTAISSEASVFFLNTPPPTPSPTKLPTKQPSSRPSNRPTSSPSTYPTGSPSAPPSARPFSSPTGGPSKKPSSSPSDSPTSSPSSSPTRRPSEAPSTGPTGIPSATPSSRPSSSPSSGPSAHPISSPSLVPSSRPSLSPSALPSSLPTTAPSIIPSESPSDSPSESPSSDPSDLPSSQPSSLPTSLPSTYPSHSPSISSAPSQKYKPSMAPSKSSSPSEIPSKLPSPSPSGEPSALPSYEPSIPPSDSTSSLPSLSQSDIPSRIPSTFPSAPPSDLPSSHPSSLPSSVPSSSPSYSPSISSAPSFKEQPSNSPSMSSSPSSSPSSLPSLTPTMEPSRLPSSIPSGSPTEEPSDSPSSLPSNLPSRPPSSIPSDPPSGMPSISPSQTPSSIPSDPPSGMPSISPSQTPSSMPSGSPSDPPSSPPTAMPSRTPSQVPSSEPSKQPTVMPVPPAPVAVGGECTNATQCTLAGYNNATPTVVECRDDFKNPPWNTSGTGSRCCLPPGAACDGAYSPPGVKFNGCCKNACLGIGAGSICKVN